MGWRTFPCRCQEVLTAAAWWRSGRFLRVIPISLIRRRAAMCFVSPIRNRIITREKSPSARATDISTSGAATAGPAATVAMATRRILGTARTPRIFSAKSCALIRSRPRRIRAARIPSARTAAIAFRLAILSWERRVWMKSTPTVFGIPIVSALIPCRIGSWWETSGRGRSRKSISCNRARTTAGGGRKGASSTTPTAAFHLIQTQTPRSSIPFSNTITAMAFR